MIVLVDIADWDEIGRDTVMPARMASEGMVSLFLSWMCRGDGCADGCADGRGEGCRWESSLACLGTTS